MELSLPFAALHLFEPGGAMGVRSKVGDLLNFIHDIPEVSQVGGLVVIVLGSVPETHLRLLRETPTGPHILGLVSGLVRGYALRYGLRSVTGRGIPATGEIRRLTGLYAHVVKVLRGFPQVVSGLDAVDARKTYAGEFPDFLLRVVREQTDNVANLLAREWNAGHNSILQ